MKITVDGIEYEVERTEAGLGAPERIVVWTLDEQLVGDMSLDHNLEHAEADIGRGAEAVGYFEFAQKTPEEIGTWIAAVSEMEMAEAENDHQPTHYEEMQDYMGGDDWDHGQYDTGDEW